MDESIIIGNNTIYESHKIFKYSKKVYGIISEKHEVTRYKVENKIIEKD